MGDKEFVYGPQQFMYNSGYMMMDAILDRARYRIKDVKFHNPATIVFWADGTKTVVKCDGEKFDPEKGLAMAISKKAFGNEGNYYNVIKKWTAGYFEE